MPEEEQAGFQPPPALPDGSMPTYGGHTLPEKPPPFGWGADLSRLDHLDHHSSRSESPILVVALIVLGGVALSVLLAALSAHV